MSLDLSKNMNNKIKNRFVNKKNGQGKEAPVNNVIAKIMIDENSEELHSTKGQSTNISHNQQRRMARLSVDHCYHCVSVYMYMKARKCNKGNQTLQGCNKG